MDEMGKVRYNVLMIYRGGIGKNKTSLFNTKYDAEGNLIKESTPTKEAVYAYNAANRMAESHITEIRGGSRQTPKDTVPQRGIVSRRETVYAYDSFGRRILEADILNRWVRHTEYRGLSMDVLNGASKNAAVHGIKMEIYYLISVTFGSFSDEATMYVFEEGVTFEIPKTLGAKASAKSPITDSVGASGSTGYRITASIQDGPHGTIKNRKSKSLNTMVNTYRYYTSSDFLKENLH